MRRESGRSIDTKPSGPQDKEVKRLPLFLLLIGVMFGLATQLPAQAFAGSTRAMAAAGMAQNERASMLDCKSAPAKKTPSAPCKCGVVGCLMTTSGAAILLPDGSALAGASVASKLARPFASLANLRGRSTVPEPEPPSFLI
jgi:hypothetical protein